MRHQRLLIALSLTLLLSACGGAEGGTDSDAAIGGGDATTSTDAATPEFDTTAPIDTTVTDPQADASPADEDAAPAPVEGCADQADGAACDDGNACTVDDTCNGGQCVGGSNLVCDSTDSCRTPACDPDIGCYTTEVEDGTACSAGCFETATCQWGSCQVDPESAVVCPEPEDPCVDQLQCDPATGACTVSIFKATGTACDADDNVCTEELCTDTGVCETTGEVNTCQEENDNNPCWTWSCSSKTGCYQTTFVEGVSCDDNNPCTYSDICTINEIDQELCVGEALPIDDGNPCTDDACVGGTITHEPIDGISCEVDGCDQPGLCSGGLCEEPAGCGCTSVDGGWSEWAVGDCDAQCGQGQVLASRSCNNPAPSCGGAECEGPSTEYQICEAGDCAEGLACEGGQCVSSCSPVDGGWSAWSYGACDAQCGQGLMLATRACNNPPPSCGGADCAGTTSEMQTCDAGSCPGGYLCSAGSCVQDCSPVNGGWSDWVWGPCSVECGGGTRTATRNCNSPAPSCGGADCPGMNTMSESCNTQDCAPQGLPLGKTIYDHPAEVVVGAVPDGVTSITVSMWGAGGAGGLPGVGGAGAWVHGTIAVNPGDSVELRVASGGGDSGTGGGASYAFVNGQVMMVAAGGGGGGSDGNSGKSADAGSGSGGGGGALGGAGQAGTINNVYGCGSAGGQGGQQSAGGQGGTSNNQSMYTSGCISAGEAGVMHQGGGTHKGGSCSVSQTGGSWHEGGASSATNGEGAGGGAGYYGGGSGATFWTYAGGGGGGGSSWAHSSVTNTQSEGGSGISAGGMGAADYNGTAGRGGMPGDWSNWPTTTIDPELGSTGLIVLSL